ncbi:MAG TPA: serine/threonine-protein kinase [Acidimicrobiia bacterium]|nr:serine/threonine-protein kinase [Acidimicrobiia bacterium]
MTTELHRGGRYRVERRIGQGAMGAVLLARDTLLGRVVAVKVLAEHLAGNDGFRRRFVQEARLAARLCHPNVVQVFDAGEEDGRPFLVMEYVDGESVADRLARRQPFGPDEVVALAAQVAAGLAHAHSRGIVHRDVKPHNVILRADGVAKLTDFGIARAMEDSGLTEVGTVLGTAPFMAPEQAAGRPVGPPADVYALGALVRHVAAGPLTPGLGALVEAAMAADPAARPTAAGFRDRLEDGGPAVAGSDSAVGDGSPGGAADSVAADAAPTEIPAGGPTEVLPQGGSLVPPPPVPPAGAVSPATRRPWGAAVVAVAALFVVLLALALHLASSGNGHPTPAPAPAATATATATSGPPAGAPATSAPAAADPSGAARDLATWLRGQGR